ncbi:MAG: hypothetical protein KDK90_05360 [Leptospiraceae bacterium]|nr:hypothetical protein [Leptospiraceae bacterium]
MLREIVIPKASEFVIKIPMEYINRKIEILVFPIDQENKPVIIREKFNNFLSTKIKIENFKTLTR